MSRKPFYAALPLVAVSLAGMFMGCGGPGDAPPNYTLNPVKGTVLLEDGKPVTSGRVVLVSPTTGIAPSGKIGSDGTFTVSTGEQGEGAPAGEYKVKIEPEFGLGGPGKPQATRLPYAKTYTDEDVSGLKVTVKDGENTLPPFKLSNKNAVIPGLAGGSPARGSLRD